jgi:hypothetical protein
MDKGLGTIGQISYLVEDIGAACRTWVDTQGVGPWTIVRNLEFSGTYDGASTRVKLHVALAYQGDMQFELIQQLDDSPSPYRSYFQRGCAGIHHIGYLIEGRIDALVEKARIQGLELRFDVRSQIGTRQAYLSLPGMAPVFVELVETDEAKRAMFEHLKNEAAGWDGRDPVQEIAT